MRRKKSLVDRELQFGFAWMIFGYLILYTFFLLLLFGLPIWWLCKYSEEGDLNRYAAVGSFILENQAFWILLAGFIIMVTIHSVIISRKFGGPIFVIRRHLKRLLNGEISAIHLRQKDSFHDLKDLLNEHFNQLKAFVDTVKSSKSNLSDLCQQLKNNLDSENPDPEYQKTLLQAIDEEIEKINKTTSEAWRYPS
ncbi:methyl-accepting chemotaxis protein [bacterium]|nr:methyl-accepting chemotaxis protein [candidate division CSSED10-310 bacterium]